MSSSILEQLRRAHEDQENIAKAISRLLMDRDKNKKFAPKAEFCVKELVKLSQDSANQALEIYADKDGMRREEVDYLGGKSKPAPGKKPGDVWTHFYDKVKTTRDYHRKWGNAGGALNTAAAENHDANWFYDYILTHSRVDTLFTGEEAYGQRVDLHADYLSFINLKKIKEHRAKVQRGEVTARLRRKHPDMPSEELERKAASTPFEEIDYIAWLGVFDQFHTVPRYCKYRDSNYLNFVKELDTRLIDLFRRCSPLTDADQHLEHFEEDFAERYEKDRVQGWATRTHRDPLFVLPTNRLFSNENTKKAHMTGKEYKKAVQKMQKMSLEEQGKFTKASEDLDRDLAFLECRIQRFKDLLADKIDATRAHLEKKQSRTAEELELDAMDSEVEEMDDIEVPEEESEEGGYIDEERPVYNPLNLPMGWDGKPIPFWLYKLHGLGIEYKCEICGNYSYWGRRAFERHFSEWRHAFGMRCLQIPNTMHFKEITQIEDAVVLYEKLKRDAEDQTFRAEVDVECEDAQGNVMSLRAYEDLRRQGLV